MEEEEEGFLLYVAINSNRKFELKGRRLSVVGTETRKELRRKIGNKKTKTEGGKLWSERWKEEEA